MEFANPNWLYGLYAVPVVAVFLYFGGRRRSAELARFTGQKLGDALAPGRSWRKSLLKGTLKTVALALILFALAGPRFGSQLVKVEREGVDLVIALDTSLSMLAEDMLPNRLERAKQEIIDLIKGLRGDRVGIVVFAGGAYALCPLTIDYEAALMFARTVDVDMVSEPGTAVEKALERSVALFEESDQRDRAIILVTDGENHEGDPVALAQKAGDQGIRIFTIGIGNPNGELIPERGTDGSIAGYKKDRKGQTVLTQLDEVTLQQIAAASDGEYLPATREGLELKVLYNEISGMDRRTIEGEFIERKKERFWIFLAAALLALLLDTAVSGRAVRWRDRRRLLHTGAAAVLATALLGAWTARAAAKTVDRSKVKSGNTYYSAAEYDKALTLYKEALRDTIDLPQNYEGVFYNQANTLTMMERYEEAINLYQRSVSADTLLTGKALYNRANAFLQAGMFGPAVESYVQALQYMPDDPDARHNLELALRMLEQQQQQQQEQQSGDGEQEQQQQQQQEQQQGEQQEQEQQQQQNQQDSEEQDEQEQEPAPPDTSSFQPQQIDSTAVPPPQLSPEDMQKLSREDAMRILQALEEMERRLQEEKRKAAFKRRKKSGKDW